MNSMSIDKKKELNVLFDKSVLSPELGISIKLNTLLAELFFKSSLRARYKRKR